VAPDPLLSEDAEEVDRPKRYMLVGTLDGYTIYGLDEPGIPVREFPFGDQGVEDASQRWGDWSAMPDLVGYLQSSGYS
jgi:hypothetical protein